MRREGRAGTPEMVAVHGGAHNTQHATWVAAECACAKAWPTLFANRLGVYYTVLGSYECRETRQMPFA